MPDSTPFVVPADGMTIERDTTFAPGTYFLPNGVKITADNITLDGNGAVLIGVDCEGVGGSLEN